MLNTLDEILVQEANVMGRPVKRINAHRTEFHNSTGTHSVWLVVYDCPGEFQGQVLEETRFVVVVDGLVNTGRVV